ncbi:unnamed protein product [Nezara viridula]|uniref:G-protein coupled receptors family 1 profile domain-containing protein n=1 Tax=Nezara viridula TaxID=85310 RepID=A0A9P0HMZ4_NEZVI|nr:unnamed protein product [Nezara viridula]
MPSQSENWSFGSFYCTINNYIANVTVAASVLTLTGITIDRYLAIIRPLQPRMTKTNAMFGIAMIWATSLLIGMPCLVFSTTLTHRVNFSMEDRIARFKRKTMDGGGQRLLSGM